MAPQKNAVKYNIWSTYRGGQLQRFHSIPHTDSLIWLVLVHADIEPNIDIERITGTAGFLIISRVQFYL
jgi:hypothetical protein